MEEGSVACEDTHHDQRVHAIDCPEHGNTEGDVERPCSGLVKYVVRRDNGVIRTDVEKSARHAVVDGQC